MANFFMLQWSTIIARVAQLVEHLTRNEKVMSSILVSGSKHTKYFCDRAESQLLGFCRGSNRRLVNCTARRSRNFIDEFTRRGFVTDLHLWLRDFQKTIFDKENDLYHQCSYLFLNDDTLDFEISQGHFC